VKQLVAFLFVLSVLAPQLGCSGRDPMDLEVSRAKIDPVVFDDDYSPDVYFQAFAQTNVVAVQLDSVYAYNGYAPDGARSLKINIAPGGSALGSYSGGVLTSVASRDFLDYNALSFWARADRDISLDLAGFGNDNTGTSLYEASRSGIPLTRDWQHIIVPIPNPSKLIAERGLFTFAEGLEEQYPDGYDIWVDEIRFVKVDSLTVFRPTLRSVNRQYFVGSTVNLDGASTVFQLGNTFLPVNHSPNYFDFESSDPSVAKVIRGRVQVSGVGKATITATLQGYPAIGSVSVAGYEPPRAAPPTPTLPASDVISLWSDTYPNVTVDTWRADWGGVTTQVEDYTVGNRHMKLYSSLNWVGIDFLNKKIDASSMTHLHVDVYAPAGTNFKLKVVSFPSQLTHSVETQEKIFNATSTPAFHPGSWSSLEIPLTDFQLPTDWDWSRIGELVLASTDAQLVLVDNLYWHK